MNRRIDPPSVKVAIECALHDLTEPQHLAYDDTVWRLRGALRQLQVDEHEQALLKRIRKAARQYFGFEKDDNPMGTIEEMFDCLCEWAGKEQSDEV